MLDFSRKCRKYELDDWDMCKYRISCKLDTCEENCAIEMDEVNNPKAYINKNKCPECGIDLTLHSWKESRGEHFGFPAQETMYELRCDYCGWVDE